MADSAYGNKAASVGFTLPWPSKSWMVLLKGEQLPDCHDALGHSSAKHAVRLVCINPCLKEF